MKATITKTFKISSDRRAKPGRNIVYIESPFDEVADRFASQHGIFSLPFNCKTWSKILRETNKVNIKALKDLFPDAVSIKFSAKAGCNCGCSPGYIVKTNSYLVGTNNWVTIEATEEEVELFETIINSAARRHDLHKEIAAQELVATGA